MVKIKKVSAPTEGASFEQGFVAEFTMLPEEADKLIESMKQRRSKYPNRQVRVIIREDQVFIG